VGFGGFDYGLGDGDGNGNGYLTTKRIWSLLRPASKRPDALG